jgi:radical SAM protein with 4Fe4S-binding SPASM domain
MLEGVLRMAELTAGKVMVAAARTDLINIDATLDETMHQVIDTAHSRFPVFEGERDNIIGILLAKDLLKLQRAPALNIRTLLRPPVFIPESKGLNDLLRELHQGVQKAHPCGAGLGFLGVSTEGELGLCHRFVESKSHAVGTVQQGVDEGVRTAFLERAHIDNKTDCRTCFAKPLCAGGCYHEAHVRHGDAHKPNLHACEWIRGHVDQGLKAYARIMAHNPKFFARYESQ